MKLLAFSDLHRDLDTAAGLVERSADADLVIGAGDFGSVHEGVAETIAALAPISVPTLLVPGNNETEDELRAAVADAGWSAAEILHGSGTSVDGLEFFGLGAGVPTTPWDWSFDLTEDEATARLAACPEGAVLIVHSPPKGHCDASSGGEHLGSEAILATIEEKEPPLAVCGHIHEAWGDRSAVGPTTIANLGPRGAEFEV
jgi:Icc-related predicted phosphoesterase